MKRAAAITGLVTLLTCAALTTPAPADSGSSSCPASENGIGPTPSDQLGQPLNYVVLESCQGGAEQAEAKVQVRRAGGQQQPTNYAFAYSHDCSSPCETITAAFQVVLMDANSQSQSPQNAGIGINENCSGCVAFAFADQYVVDVPPGTHLPGDTRRQIGDIRRQAQSDVDAALGFSDPLAALGRLDSQLKALADQEHQDVTKGLQSENAGPSDHHDNQHEEQKAD